MGDNGGPDKAREIFRFVLPSDPGGGVVIDAIDVYLYCFGGNGNGLYSINMQYGNNTPATTWVESQAGWNRYKTGTNWTVAGAGSDLATVVDNQPADLSTTPLATAYSNQYHSWGLYGPNSDNPQSVTWGDTVDLLFRDVNGVTGANVGYRHREYTGTSQDPYIEITYSEAPAGYRNPHFRGFVKL